MGKKHKQISKDKEEIKKSFIIAPDDKAKGTVGIAMKGRITFKQYEFLVENGFDGDIVKKWTKYKASQEITKIINKNNCGILKDIL